MLYMKRPGCRIYAACYSARCSGYETLHDEYEIEAEYDFSSGVRGRFYRPRKRSATIRFDDDLILYFKKWASERKISYRTLMNSALREYVNRQIHGE